MIPAFLITFREIIEASLIVATILGILTKIGHRKSKKTVYLATVSAMLVSFLLLGAGSMVGLRIQNLYTGTIETVTEGSFMIISAVFITWAVFVLHKQFAQKKIRLLQSVRHTLAVNEQKGIFFLVFTAVFREGFEIVLFLSTIYFSSKPLEIVSGFSIGLFAALIVSFGLFTATIRLPVYQTFRMTSILLILFAAGLAARGVHEFAELGMLPELGKMTIAFLPDATSFTGDMIRSLFGISRHMDALQLAIYSLYVAVMSWYVFLRDRTRMDATEEIVDETSPGI